MLAVTTSDPSPSKPLRPWWREPMAVLFGLVILLACAAIMAQGWILPPKPVDPTKPAPLPGGGSFCDTPAPTKSTLEKPK
jgi:hypothetical protein